MTVIEVDFRDAIAGNPVAVELECAPSARHQVDDHVVLPVPVTVDIDGTGQLELEPTGPGWCWKVVEQVTGLWAHTRYVLVPAGGAVSYADLVDVDPATLAPAAEPEPAWWAASATVNAGVASALEAAALAGDVASAAADTAAAAASVSASAATLAADVADDLEDVTAAVATKADDTRASRARALRSFHVALADVDTSPVDVAFLGDSWLAGYGATTYAKGLAHRIVEGLRALHQPAGVPGGLGSVGLVNTAPGMAHPVVYSTATPGAAAGLSRSSLVLQQGQQINLAAHGTGFDLIYTADGDGDDVLAYTLDGGGYVWVDNTGPGTRGVRLPIRGLTRGLHQLVLGSGGTVRIEDLVAYDGDEAAGIRARVGGTSGTTAEQLATTPWWDDELGRVEPALTVLGVLANDWMLGRTPEQGAASLDVVLERTRAAAPSSSIALLAYPQIAPRDPEWAPWSEFVDVIVAAAAGEPDVIAIDLEPAFGPYDGTTRGGLMIGDTAHPSHGGHAAAARLVVDAVT